MELIDARGREAVRQFDLIFGKDVDGEPLRVGERRVTGGAGRLAPQHQGWIEGDRAEGVRRQPPGPAFCINCRDDSDSGDEGAQYPAEFLGVETGFGSHGGHRQAATASISRSAGITSAAKRLIEATAHPLASS